MTVLKNCFRRRWVLVALFTSVSVFAIGVVELTTGIPNPFNATESAFQNQTHFLVFTGSDTPGETAQTATAYYNAIDPSQSKRTFEQWLVNAGFIANTSQWHPTGQQIIACDLPGCDLPSHDATGNLTYGDNIINTDSHAIIVNAADLGFVRNQFIRCVPSCQSANPIVYTYLENYPVNAFAASGNGGSGFPSHTGFPSQAEATAAIQTALTRPLGKLVNNPVYGGICNDDSSVGPVTTDTVLGCNIQRIADVAFEWAPPPTNPGSSSRYGQLYAFVFSTDGSGISDQVHTQETISVPPPGFQPNFVGQVTPNVANHTLNAVAAGDPFPPNLDFLGFKQHPGVCFICHGGKPQNLTAAGAYPNRGKVDGFRFLPLDVRNLIFTSDTGAEATSRVNQEAQLKEYNLAVLFTVPKGKQFDGQTSRVAHLREVVTGWYTDDGGTPFARATQNSDFIPVGWRESLGAPAGSEKLYREVVSPSCRSCHFNREISLDFGTYQNFKQESDILQLALLPQCTPTNGQAGAKYMPLAHLTYQRYWQENTATGGPGTTLPDGFPINSTADQIAQYFGFSSVAAYCATNP